MADDGQDRPPESELPTRSDKRPPAESPGDTALPRKSLGDFELLREIGRGGMGVVYEARQISLKRRVALKVLPPGLGLTDQAVQRFEREAQAAAKLHHTNIVPVYATGQDQGCHYYAMELVEGQSLSRVLDDLRGERSSPLMEATVTQVVAESSRAPADEPTGVAESTTFSDTDTGGRQWFDTVAKLMADVGDALHYSHERGVIHRDVKPANLLLAGDGRLCLGDFGLARVAQEPGMTVSGSFLGTPAYMSPEQVAAGRMKLDHRTDIYSLGAVLFEMLTHQRPFPGDSREEILGAILTKDPRHPRRINPRVPVDLETICLKAMEKDPDRRYATAADMSQDLRQYLQGGLIAARRAGPIRRSIKFVRRHPVGSVAAVAAILLLLVGGLAWRATQRGARQESWRLVSEAKLAMSQGSYRDALRKADTVLASEPDEVEARLIRARSLIKIGRPEEAITEAEYLLEQDADDWTAHAVIVAAVKQSFAAYGMDVEPHVEAVERLAPETAEAYTLRALVTDVPSESLKLLDRAVEIDPGYADALESRAQTQIRLKDFQAALEDAGHLTVARPRSAAGWHLRGNCYWRLHDYERASSELERAIRIDPDNPFSYFYRAVGRFERGDVRGALADIDRAIAIDPDIAFFYEARGDGYYRVGRFREAQQEIDRAIELNPDNPWNFSMLAQINRSLGDREETRRLLDRLDRMTEVWTDPEIIASVHRTRSWTLGTLGDHQQALVEAERAVEAEPEGSWNYLQRAAAKRHLEGEVGMVADCEKAASLEVMDLDELLWRAGSMQGQCNRRDLALRDYDRLIELAPNWPDPYRARGLLQRREKRPDAALADFDRAAELAPKWELLWADRGQVLADVDRYDEAVEAYEQARELGNQDLDTLHQQAAVLLVLGRQEEAFGLWDRIIEEMPQASGVYLVRAWGEAVAGRADEAVAYLDRAIEAAPEAAGAAYILRAEYGLFGDLVSCDAAQADLDKALTEVPGNATLESHVARARALALARSCPELYDPDETLAMARRGAAFDSDDGSMHFHLGAVLYRNGEYEEALRELELANELNVRQEHFVPLLQAMASWKLGDRETARAHYDFVMGRINKYYPDYIGFPFVRQELEPLLGIERK